MAECSICGCTELFFSVYINGKPEHGSLRECIEALGKRVRALGEGE